jgi:hypothetical protein
LPTGWIHGEQITTYAEHLQGQQLAIGEKILLLPTVFMDRLEKKNTDKLAFSSALRILNAQVLIMYLNMSHTFQSYHHSLTLLSSLFDRWPVGSRQRISLALKKS